MPSARRRRSSGSASRPPLPSNRARNNRFSWSRTDARRDALRRDFTINGLLYDPLASRVIDHVGGQADLEAKILRCIGDPHARFGEDRLRMLRAVRFTHTLDFTLDGRSSDAIRVMADRISRISAERIEAELTRTLTESARPGDVRVGAALPA